MPAREVFPKMPTASGGAEDKETRRGGDKENAIQTASIDQALHLRLPVSLSPCLLVSHPQKGDTFRKRSANEGASRGGGVPPVAT